MIHTKKDLMEYEASDNSFFTPKGLKSTIAVLFTNSSLVMIKRYLRYLRKQEYYINTANDQGLHGVLGLWYERRKNSLGNQLGIDIGPNCIDKGCSIYHPPVVVNYHASIGKNCRLHGNNCIGNDGKSKGCPRIGDNVDIGYGAVIIGDISIADNVVIGANCVVTKSIVKPNCVVAGVPGKVIKERK